MDRSAFSKLEQDAWQPRLAMDEDVPTDKKTRERTEGRYCCSS